MSILNIILKWLLPVDWENVLFQITNLRKPFLTMLTLVGTNAIMLTKVVPDGTGLLEGYVTTFVQTFIIGSRFVWSVILNADNLYLSSWYTMKFIFQIFSNKDIWFPFRFFKNGKFRVLWSILALLLSSQCIEHFCNYLLIRFYNVLNFLNSPTIVLMLLLKAFDFLFLFRLHLYFCK